jgi:hypothetical protein
MVPTSSVPSLLYRNSTEAGPSHPKRAPEPEDPEWHSLFRGESVNTRASTATSIAPNTAGSKMALTLPSRTARDSRTVGHAHDEPLGVSEITCRVAHVRHLK